jgi:DNA-binding transcriptional LysR family regulator
MRSFSERGVPSEEHPVEEPFDATPDWDNIRAFLALTRHGSFRSAAESLGISTNALRRRIDDLECSLGTTLVTRHVDGVRTTTEGADILAAALKMEEAAFSLLRARDQSVPSVAGIVRVAVTEAFGTFWLGPRLIDFQRAYPKLTIDLNCEMRSADVLRLKADLSVQLDRPKNPDVKVVRLGRIHSMPGASPSYLAIYGMPKSIEDLRKHRLALQFNEQTRTQELYDKIFAGVPQENFVTFRTNNSSALLWAIIKGAGIGWSPTYIHMMGPKLQPIDIEGLVFPFDVWLAYHPDAARVSRTRRVIDWVIENFNPKKYPWFRDEFIHPRELPARYDGPPLVNLFEGTSWPSFAKLRVN